MTEAEILFTEVLKCDRAFLYLNRDLALGKEKGKFISAVLNKRLKGEPIQYILGKTEFMGLEFKVTPDVLIPRPETEILIETVVDCIVKFHLAGERLEILDLGTGSGCIAVSLAKILANVEITAIDISLKAIRIAQENALKNKVAEKIVFIKSDLFRSLPPRKRYAICVSNPPYVISREINELQPELKYEPRIALDGGKGGLDFYRQIIKNSRARLKNGGLLIMEMGFNQDVAIKNIFHKIKDFEVLGIVKDYSQINRVVIAKYRGK